MNMGQDAKSKIFKSIGGLIILGSFLTQQFFLERYREEFQEYLFDYQHYSNSYMASLQYVNMFFSSAIATERLNNQILSKAASENMSGVASFIKQSNISSEEKVSQCLALISRASQVQDLNSYNAYIGYVNDIEGKLFKGYSQKYGNLKKKKKVSFNIFASLYVFGSIFVLLGIKYEPVKTIGKK